MYLLVSIVKVGLGAQIRCPGLPLAPAVQFGGVVWLFRYPADVALSVGINLAQIGEFGFVLLSVAHQYGLVPSQVYMLLMGES